jgi:hypothetical protein
MGTINQETQTPATSLRIVDGPNEPASMGVAAQRATQKMDATHVPLSGLYQIGFVTTDLEEAMALFSDTYGISKFKIRRDLSSAPGMPRMTVHLAHAYVGPMMIELIQPAGGEDALYREILPHNGFAIRPHHYGFMVRSEQELDRISAALETRSVPIAVDASMPEVARAVYADARSTLGHYLEYVYVRPEARRGYYAQVPHN